MLGLHVVCVCLCVGLRMSVDHPSYSQTNKWKGGLKFLLPTFKAHGRNSSVIEVKGERRESRGRAKGWTGRATLQMLGLGFTVCTLESLAWACFDLDKSSMHIKSFVSAEHQLVMSPVFSCQYTCLFIIFSPPLSVCLNFSPPEWRQKWYEACSGPVSVLYRVESKWGCALG